MYIALLAVQRRPVREQGHRRRRLAGGPGEGSDSDSELSAQYPVLSTSVGTHHEAQKSFW